MLVIEAIISALLSGFSQVAFDRISPRTNLIEFLKRHDFNENLFENLKNMMLEVNAVLGDAEEKQVTNPFVRLWLNELKDAAYHTADLLDEIHSLALAKSQGSSTSALNNILKKSEVDLEKMTEKLENIAKHKDVLGLKESFSGKPSPRLQPTSLVDEFEVHGRGNDKENIRQFLLSGRVGENEIPTVAIVGIAGVGKTTLAQLLYNDPEVKQQFRTRAWIHVSEDFDVFKVTKNIYESVTSQHCDMTNPEILQVKLKRRLTRRKFLIVLDDVWNEYYSKWDALRTCLKVGVPESRIIVTTRSQGVASTMRTNYTIRLRPLEDEDCWLVFANHAFGSPHASASSNLKSIGQEITKKCGGLPLAAKVLGSLLYSKVEVQEWRNVLNSHIWDLPNDKSDILPSLRLSYYHLPFHLKQCFAYCSIFPKGHKFEKEKLVLLWKAEDFLPQPRNDSTMEEVGMEYFDELLSRSFFQPARDGDKLSFIMHDLINELAQFASGESCFNFERNKSYRISSKARHFSYVMDQFDDGLLEKFDSLKEAKFLRTFLPLGCSSSSRSCSINRTVVDEYLPEQKRLRVLSLSCYGNISKLPDKFGKFMHLRYLDLSHNSIGELPKSIVCLYNLQTLILSHCIQLARLPAKMRKLINLSHLDLNGTNSLEMMPLKFGRLKRLQILTAFVVSNDTSGSSVSELGGLSHLSGKLSIFKLQNVRSVEHAENAKLKDKENIKELEFNWSSSGRLDQKIILEKLCPHENIEKVSIAGYGGTRLPDWLGDSSFSKMVILRLSDCNSCSYLPSLGQLSSLQQLHVTSMPKCEQWLSSPVTGGGYPSLQELNVENCEELTAIPNNLTSLKLLSINKCRQLKFDDFLGYEKLQNLHIRSCDCLKKLTLNFYPELESLQIHDCKDLRFLIISNNPHQNLKFLKNLEISECPCLEKFYGGGLRASKLTYFSVSNCKSLQSMPERMRTLLRSLQTLDISDCPNLVSFQDGLPVSLQTLTIKNCVKLTPQTAWGLRNMTSLTYLRIDCAYDNVTSFPDDGLLPTSLTNLQIRNFQVLRTLNVNGLRDLTLLKELEFNCNQLEILSEGILPCSLSHLSITGCESLTDNCRDHYRNKISHISVKIINGNYLD